MRFSDFLLVSDPSDLNFIVGYSGEQNIRIDVADFIAGNITGFGTIGYVPVFTGPNSIGNSQLFQDGSNIVIGGVNAMGYRLSVYGGLYSHNASIESFTPGSDTFRTIGEEGDSFIIPNDEDESIWTSRRIMHAPAVLTTESATLGQLNTAISNLEGDIELLLDLKVDKSSVGEPNGVASLDATGKIPLSEIPDSIIGQVEYMGTWNALTNTPTLNPLVPEEKGHYYVVSVAGTFGGLDYQVGDWIISNGVYWDKIDNTDAVTSVFGRIGAILALEADYQSFYPRLSQAYDNPTWINTLAFSKITDVPPFLLENQTITLSGDVTGSGKTSIASTISNNAVTDSKLRDSVGTSVIGRASSTTGDPADIQASTDGHVLQRSGGTLLFGLISSDSIGSIDWSKIINTPTTLSGYGITNAYTKTESDNKFVPYTGANANVNLGSNNITANSFIKAGGTSAQFLKADGSVDTSQYVPTTRSINAGTGLTGGGNLSSDVNIAFDTTWGDTRYAYRTRQLTINGTTYDLSADRIWNVGTVTSVGLSMPSAFTVSNSPVIGAGVLTVVGAGTILEYVRGDGSLATFPSLTGYVTYTGATQNVDLGEYGISSGYFQADLTPTQSAGVGRLIWNNADGTLNLRLLGGNVDLHLGQQQYARVVNGTGGNVLRSNYQVVKIIGAQGQRMQFGLARADNDFNSKDTIGLIAENINNNNEGFVVSSGLIEEINTTGSLQGETWADGDTLYLSGTIFGALTNIKPTAPIHTVIVGFVVYAHANHGKIFVKVDNGYELEELHDVSAEPFINNGLLYRDTTLNLWKSATISTILGYTPAPQGNYITSLTGEATASGPGAASVTLSNSAVTGKVLTGLNITGNAILSTDSILTAFGKLQNQVNQLVGGLQYEGTWNASTNTPTITSSVGTDGTFYIVSVAGTTNINGINDWEVGDWIVFHDTAWQKVDNSDSVSSVFGRVGNIVANQSDYSAFYPLISDIKDGVLTVQGSGILSGSGTFSANQATNNTITLTHASVSRTDTTSTQTPSFGGSFNVVDSVTSSAEGHITAIDTKTVTIPSTVATATQTGLLSSADWITFNGKQNAITLTTTGTSGPATLVGATLNIPNYAPDLSGYVTLGTDQTITGLKTIVRSGDVLNFKIGTDTLYGLKLFYSQNELVPSGEATWSFVNTFNRNGVGYETTPISFFRGVLVTGERLLSASINSNLLDYYGNNPSGRYPVYAYNTGVQQFSTGIIVGKTTGVVNAGTGAIADLPAGVVANFNGRVIGENAVNSNEFVTLSQVSGYVPTSRTITINGTTQDLSANRTFNVGTVTSVTASSPLASSGGTTPNITISQSSGSTNGFLSSTDWTTFNNKANANGSNASGTWGINITGTAVNLSNNWTNWNNAGFGGAGNVVGMLIWKAYGSNHVIFDASASTSPSGASVNNTNSAVAWSATYPTLMGWNGSTTYGVRVDSARVADSSGSASSVPWSGVTSKPSNIMYYQGFTLDANTMDTNSTGFTYGVNAPYTGPIARFSTGGGYDLWLNAPYGGDGYGLAFRTRNGDTGTFNSWKYPAIYGINVNGGGALYASIYYDQSNTGYYVDPASGSRMNGITYDNLTFSGDTSYGFLGRNVYADTVNGRGSDSLELNYYDGGEVHIGASYTKTLRAGVIYSRGANYGTVFYDTDNTAYYLDPNEGSVSLRIAGSIISDGSFATNASGSSSQAVTGRIYGPKGGAYSFSGGAVTGAIKIRLPFRANDSMWSMKVRIYNYGQYQTSEYLLGNYSYSQGAWNFSASYLGGSSSSPQNVRFGNDGSYDCVWIGETSTGWSYPVVSVMDFMAGYSNGGVGNYYQNWDISVVGSFGTVGATISPDIRFNNVTAVSVNAPSGYVSNGNPWGTANSAYFPNGISTAGGTNWIYGLTYIGNAPGNGAGHEFYTSGSSYSTGNMEANGSMRAPIFFDRNDTNYYLDPTSNSSLRTVGSWRSDSAGWDGEFNGKIQYHSNSWYFQAADLWLFRNSGTTNVFSVNQSGVATAVGDMRAPIFYDSNNTAYYVNPASNTYIYGPFQVNGDHGGSQIGVRLLAENNGASTGQVNLRMWCSEPGVTWDWAGFGYNVTNDGGSPGGFGRLNTNFGQAYMRFSTDGSLYFYNTNTSATRTQSLSIAPGGQATFGTDVRSPIFYDSNDTSRYINPDGVSQTNSMRASEFRGNANVGGTGEATWHPAGAYIGSTMWQYGDMYKNNTNIYDINIGIANSSLRAPIFYDSNNTSYYIDAASTSVLHTLLNIGGWLEVRSNVYATNPTTTAGLFFGWNKSGGNGEANIIVDGGSDTGQFLFQRYNGSGSYTNIFQADIYGLTANSGTVSVFSDIRLKTNITNASPKLDDLMKLNVVNYEFVGEYDVLGKQLGFIAQEVEQIFPSLVREQDTRQYDDQGNCINGYKDTKILKVGMEFAMLVKAMQEQQSIIDSLKSEIETLKQKQL